MIKPDQLQQLVFKLLDSELTISELNIFIRYCASIATAHLFSRKKSCKLSHELMSADTTRVQQEAITSIADLFARDGNNKLYKLNHYYSPHADLMMESPVEALFLTRRLIVAHTKQHLVKSYADNDPSGARIYRNLGLVPKRDEHVKLVDHGDKQFFFYWDRMEAFQFPEHFNPDKPAIDWEDAKRLVEDAKVQTKSFPQIVRSVLIALAGKDEIRHFIGRRELFKLVHHTIGMRTVSLDAEENRVYNTHEGHYGITELDQAKFLTMVVERIHIEIESRYVRKNKIGEQEAPLYMRILKPYFQDLIMDGFSGKLPEYRKNTEFGQFSNVSWKVHRGRLEYLIKLGREQLKDLFEREFLNPSLMQVER